MCAVWAICSKPAPRRPEPARLASVSTQPDPHAPAHAQAAPAARGLSLRRQLLIWLLLPQLLLMAAGGWLAYRIALASAEKAIDQTLTLWVRALARQVKPIGSGLLIDLPRAAQDLIELDPQDRVSYTVSSPPGRFLLGNAQLPAPPLAPGAAPLLYDAEHAGRALRVAALEIDYGEAAAPQRLRVQVAKSRAEQRRLATELLADVLAPMAALMLLLGALGWAGIRHGLAPLTRLSAQLRNRQATALLPIELDQAPREVLSLAQAVNALLAAVRRSLGKEKRFLNDAAHQLRTPLAGLIGQAELALSESDPQALRERLGKVLAGAQRSAHLVHQLLALARNEAEVALKPLDLAELAREVAREHAPRALAAGIDLGFEGPAHCATLGEPLLLREALVNLIDNALRYAGAPCAVTVEVGQAAGQVWLAVRDDGVGVAPAALAHLFERFWRASDTPGGCGLGLAIVAEVAARHAGTAHAQALSPQGLCIRMNWPSAPVQTA